MSSADDFDPAADADAEVDVASSGAADDGLPGVTVAGYPGLRAGAFGQGGGALGLYRVDHDQDSDAAGGHLIPAAYFGKGPDVLPDYQTKSWRWNDPEAMAYDADRKRMQLGQVQGMTHALEGVGLLNKLPNWPARIVGGASLLLGYGESTHLQDQLDALEARHKQLKGRSGA